MIELQAIRVDAGGRTILGPVDLAILPGTLTSIIGPNGAGKSTLVKVLSGEIRPFAGTVRQGGEPIDRMMPEALAARRAVLSQAIHLSFPFTVMEVVRLGLQGRAGLLPAARRRIAIETLRRVDLAGFEARQFASLSGGEQQRVHLARVLCQVGAAVEDDLPKLLVLDEPIASLDIRHQIEVLRIARDFADEGGAVVAVLHDINLAAGFSDRLVVMRKGLIAGDGEPDLLMKTGLIPEVFGIAMSLVHSIPGHGTVLLPDFRRAVSNPS